MIDAGNLFFAVVQTILTGAIGLVAWFIKDLRQTIRENQRQQDEDLDELRDKFEDLRAGLPQRFVLRDDFIRAVAALDGKIDSMSQDIRDIAKAVNQLIGGRGGDA